MFSLALSPLTIVKLGVVLLGLCNLRMTLKGRPPPSHSTTEPRRLRLQDHPTLELLHLDLPTAAGPRLLFTEDTVHYPVDGPRAEREWASLVPEGNHGLVLVGPDARPYAVSMFHTLHCLDRIRKAIVRPPPPPTDAQGRYHVHHCFNYVRQMILCAANTRLNPTNHVRPSGVLASDGIGLMYTCRDWDQVYEAFEANYALNRTMSFAR